MNNGKIKTSRILIAIAALLVGIALIVGLVMLIMSIISNFSKPKMETTMCSLVSDQKQNNYVLETKYEITTKDKIVTKVHIEEVITSSSNDILEKYKEQWEKQYSYNKKTYGGYEYTVEIKGDKVTSNVDIDYETMNLQKFIKFNVAMEEYVNENKQMTLEGITNMYKKSGANCQ